MKIAGKVDKKFTTEAKAEQVVLIVVGVVRVDGRVTELDDGLDWVDGIVEVVGVEEVTRIDDRLDQIDGVIGIANKVDIHRVIDLL